MRSAQGLESINQGKGLKELGCERGGGEKKNGPIALQAGWRKRFLGEKGRRRREEPVCHIQGQADKARGKRRKATNTDMKDRKGGNRGT